MTTKTKKKRYTIEVSQVWDSWGHRWEYDVFLPGSTPIAVCHSESSARKVAKALNAAREATQ